MPISAHLLRKLESSLGVDAAAELQSIVDTVEATRADLAELRHEVRREFATINARLDTMATKTELAVIRTRQDEMATKADLKDALWTQTRWTLGGLILILVAILFRG